MKGSTFKRCACKDAATGRQLGAQCPKLSGRRHGTWYYAVPLPDENGRRRQLKRGGFATQREAQEALDEVRRRLGAGQDVNDRQTTGQWLEEWLEAKRRLRPTTARSYAAHVRLYLVPHLGRVPLEKLRPAHVAAMFDAIAEENAARVGKGARPVGPATMQRIRATLRSALNAAVKQQRIQVNPAVYVEMPEACPPKVRPWEPAELGRFLDAAAGDRLARSSSSSP